MSASPFDRDSNSLTATLEIALRLVVKNNVKSVLKAKTCTKKSHASRAKSYAIFVEKRGAQQMLCMIQETKSCAPLISQKRLLSEKLLVCIVYYPLYHVK